MEWVLRVRGIISFIFKDSEIEQFLLTNFEKNHLSWFNSKIKANFTLKRIYIFIKAKCYEKFCHTKYTFTM